MINCECSRKITNWVHFQYRAKIHNLLQKWWWERGKTRWKLGGGKCWMKQSARAPPNHLHLTLSPSHDMASPSPSHDIRPPSSFYPFFNQHNTIAVSWRLQKKLQFPAHTEGGAQGCLSSYWSSPSPHAWHEGFFDNGPQFIQHASLRNWEKWRVWL